VIDRIRAFNLLTSFVFSTTCTRSAVPMALPLAHAASPLFGISFNQTRIRFGSAHHPHHLHFTRSSARIPHHEDAYRGYQGGP
jgi:hypothetical protein